MILTSLSGMFASCTPEDVLPIELCRVGLGSACTQLEF